MDFDRERQRLAKIYSHKRMALSLIAYLLFVSISFLAIISGLSEGLENLAARVSSNSWIVVLVYASIAYGAILSMSFPFSILSHLRDRRFNLSLQTWKSWSKDEAKSAALGSTLFLLSVELMYWTMREFGPLWWIASSLLALSGAVLMTYVAPTIIMPLFFKLEPLDAQPFAGRLRDLAKRSGVPILGVYKVKMSEKTKRASAALVGLGRTRRIVVSDNLLDNYSEDEVEVILAHELAHHKNRDVLIGLATSALIIVLIFFFSDRTIRVLLPFFGSSDISRIWSLPLMAVLLSFTSILILPFSNLISRQRERKADLFSIEMTQKPYAFVSAIVKLHDQNLSYANPHSLSELLFHSHPSGMKRIALAKNVLAPSQ